MLIMMIIVLKMAFTIFYQNIRGMKSKTHEIYNSIVSNSYDIICICETWLDDSILSSEIFDSRYQVIRRDRNKTFCKEYNKSHGGGVLIAVLRTFEVVIYSL